MIISGQIFVTYSCVLYLSVHKLVALLFNFRTSCKLQPKYDVAFVGDSSIIGYFCGRQLLSQQHQPCSPKVQTNIQNNVHRVFECPLTLNVQTTKNPSMGLRKLGNLFKTQMKRTATQGIKKVQKRNKERKKFVYAYLHLLKLLSVSFMSR